MLTLENDPEEEKLEVHTDIQGLMHLRSVIDSLIVQTEKMGTENVHLVTEEWGGEGAGLISDKQHPKINFLTM